MKNNGTMPTAGVPTGAQMVLKALGLDPQMISNGIEGAKAATSEVMKHFDARLTAIEGKIDSLIAHVTNKVQ